MKEELQGKLVEILTSIQAAAGKAGDFAMTQLPEVAQSYVVYGRAWATLEALMFAAVFAAMLLIAIRYGWANKEAVKKNNSYDNGEWFGSRIAASVFGTLGAVVFGIVAMYSMQNAALVWLAPKVWLLKEIAGLLR